MPGMIAPTSTMSYSRSNSSRYLLLIAAVALFFGIVSQPLVAGESAGSPAYTVTDLGALPNIADNVQPSLSSSGDVSLWTKAASDEIHAAVWHDGQLSDLGVPIGFSNSIARGISDHGQTVGWLVTSKNPVDSLAVYRAFYDDGRGIQMLPPLGGKNSRAFAVNPKGQVVGAADTVLGTRHAFLYDQGSIADLGTLPGGAMSTAYAINAGGEIAGSADAGKGARHAVVWKDGKIHDLGVLPGGRESDATAIDDRGDVAGYGETPDGYHAFLWNGRALKDLGTLKDDPSSAWALNNRGQVVGSSGMGHYVLHAFLWQNGHMADLNSLIPEGSGWTLTRAVAINDSGEIVCLANKADHLTHVLLLTPAAGLKSNQKG